MAQDAKRTAAAAQQTAQTPAEMDADIFCTDSTSPVKLVFKGFIDRMVSVVDDGKNKEAHFVDNDNAESRIMMVGTFDATEDLMIGTNIELTIAPNKSGNVDQENKEVTNIFDQRKTELIFDSKRYGKLSLGKGDTASFQTDISDLSGTTVIAYSSISDTAGGIRFREKDGDVLTDVRILDAFNYWDGLGRLSRVRYDTPKFGGFTLGFTAASDKRYDAAVRWGGQGYGIKAAASAAIADPNVDGQGINYNGSFSVLHEASGWNFTFSAGSRKNDGQGDPYNLYGKLGWRKTFFSFGETAFAVDYTRSKRIPDPEDHGYSVGIAAVQQIDDFGMELYALYRLHSLDREEGAVHDVNVFTVGTRVRF